MRFSKRYVAALVFAICAAVNLAGCTSPSGSTKATASAGSSPTRPAKPAAEHVPDSKVLTVSLLPRATSAVAPAAREVAVTDAATIARVADDINALPVEPVYPVEYCPALVNTPQLTLDFRNAPAGPVLAEVVIGPYPSGPCSSGVQVSIGGVKEPRLDDSGQSDYLARIAQLVAIPVPADSGTVSGAPVN